VGRNGLSALDYAIAMHRVEIVACLAECGATTNLHSAGTEDQHMKERLETILLLECAQELTGDWLSDFDLLSYSSAPIQDYLWLLAGGGNGHPIP
jgi:hypothetical protein